MFPFSGRYPRCARSRAFTLIELIVVVIIIAVLAAIGAVAYNQYASKARVNSVLASASSLRTALMAAAARDDHTAADEASLLWDQTGGDSTAFLTALSAHYDGPVTFTAGDSGPATLLVGSAGAGSHTACLALTEPPTVTAGECGGAAPGGANPIEQPLTTASRTISASTAFSSIAVAPDGSRLYLVKNGAVVYVDPVTGTKLDSAPVQYATQMAVSPDGQTGCVTSGTYHAYLVNLVTKTVTGFQYVSGYDSNEPVISADGSTCYFNLNDRIESYSLPSGSPHAEYGDGHDTNSSHTPVAVSVDNSVAYRAPGNVLSVFTGSPKKVSRSVSLPGTALAMVASPDGRSVYVALANGTVVTVDTSSWSVTATIQVGAAPRAAVLSPTGRYLYVANSTDGTVSVIDTTTQNVVKTVAVAGSPTSLAITADGSTVYAGSSSGSTISVLQ